MGKYREYICEICGCVFLSNKGCKTRVPRYCSRQCAGKAIAKVKTCAYCGKEIEYKDMQVDHIKPIFRGWSEEEKQNWVPEDVLGDDSMENLNPSCRMCNFRKSTFTVEGFREQIKHGLVCVNRDFTYRLLKQYGLIQETGKEVEFYFEKYKQ